MRQEERGGKKSWAEKRTAETLSYRGFLIWSSLGAVGGAEPDRR